MAWLGLKTLAYVPNDGVIVYQVQTSDPLGNAQNSMPPLNLLTKTGLIAGRSFTSANQVAVKIDRASLAAFPSLSPITPWRPCLASSGRRSRRRRQGSRRQASCRNSLRHTSLQPLAVQSARSRSQLSRS